MGILTNIKNANKNARELEAEKAKNEQLKKNAAVVAGGSIAATAGVATYGFFKRRKYQKMFDEKETELKSLDNKNQDLQIELSGLNNQVSQFGESLKSDAETIKSLREQLEQTNTRLAETRREMLQLQNATPDAELLRRVAALETEKVKLEQDLAQANSALAMASGNISQPTINPAPAQAAAPTPVQQTAPAVNPVQTNAAGASTTPAVVNPVPGLDTTATQAPASTSAPTQEPKGTAVPVINATITTTEGPANTTKEGEIVLNNTAEQQCPVQPEAPATNAAVIDAAVNTTAATTAATTSTTTSTTTPKQVTQMPGKGNGKNNKGKKR